MKKIIMISMILFYCGTTSITPSLSIAGGGSDVQDKTNEPQIVVRVMFEKEIFNNINNLESAV